MSINIQAKSDCSFLFSNLGSRTAGTSASNFLADYASIKNGSYAKLMKAYYASDGKNSTLNSITKDKTQDTTDKKALTKVETTSDALKESADALLKTGSASLFAQKDITTKDENGVESTVKGYDTEAIYKAVNSFVSNYNSVIGAVNDTSNSAINNRATTMVNATISNSKMLNKLGITINSDSTLSLDKDTFMSADMSKAKSLFNGNGSYAYRVSAQASLINYAADNAATSKGLYNGAGSFSSTGKSGNLFNSYF